MLPLKKWVVSIAALAVFLLPACSGSGSDDNSGPSSVRRPRIENAFALRQGESSGLSCLVTDKQGHIYGAGVSDHDLVLVKLDAELKTVINMVRFGSALGKDDRIKGMAMDSKGNLFVTGYSRHEDFPMIQGGFDNKGPKGITTEQAFVIKFSPQLKMLASTFIGGAASERSHAIAVDPDDNIFVAGYTKGTSDPNESFIPPAGAYDRTPAPQGQSKAFVAKLSNDLRTLKAATQLGGNRKKYESDDKAYDLAIDREGNVWVVGQAKSEDFPVTNGCIGPSLAGESDIFVSKFDADLKTLLASTYLGGRKNEQANAIVIDGQGHVYVGGWSESSDMLVFVEGYDTGHSGNEEDAFVVKLDPHLKKVEAGTFFGGDKSPEELKKAQVNYQGDDKLYCMVLSDDGKNLYVAGRTESRDFSTTPPSRITHSGNMDFKGYVKFSKHEDDDSNYGDGFIAHLDTTLTTCIFATLLGGQSLDYVEDMLIHDGKLLVAGETNSSDFPGITVNYNCTGTRGFISRLNPEVFPRYSVKKPMAFKPQFSDAEIKEIGDALLEDVKEGFKKNDFYSRLGKYAKARISREYFDAKFNRALYLYGKPKYPFGLKYHHYNYLQNGKDGYDWIELHYADHRMKFTHNATRFTTVYSNPYRGRIVMKLIAKKKKWQLADVDYRGLWNELGKRSMKLRLY